MDRWNRLSHTLTHHAGSKQFFAVAFAAAIAWALYGVLVDSGRAWELAVTCGVPILTLLMVIVLQHSQNRDAKATELKLNELLMALEAPDTKMIHAGHLGDEELNDLAEEYERKA
ncbi:low affinity iron permease family protein [Aquihabitans daechungensis]|uniref:low affinity iron permease family protein n=1 Tax=Aquihabitans daechungensis TaxID=1052257 RepID=UPI003B9E0272